MGEKGRKREWVMVNRAPVLTLWSAVVAEALGFEHDEALTLGRAVAGLNAYSKGVSLGLFQPTPKEVKEQRRKMLKEEIVTVDLLLRVVPAKHADQGLQGKSLAPSDSPAPCWTGSLTGAISWKPMGEVIGCARPGKELTGNPHHDRAQPTKKGQKT